MLEESKKKFDDWSSEVPCDSCELYYNSQCDSIKSECNSYKPTRRARLENRLRKAEDRLDTLGGLVILLWLVIVFHLLKDFIWR